MRHLRPLILLALTLTSRAAGQSPAEAFNQGNDFYRQGQYDRAAADFESILRQGYRSADIYFNLGNCYYRSGRIGQAILAYERAAHLRPYDGDIAYNLRLASLRTVDRIEPVPELFIVQWMRIAASVTSIRTTAVAFAVSWALFFCMLAAMTTTRKTIVIQFGRWVVLVCSLAIIVLALQLWNQSGQDRGGDSGIITSQFVTAKSSPDAQSVDAFVIHEGVKVKLTDAVGDWVKITLADGKVGWIKNDQCERI